VFQFTGLPDGDYALELTAQRLIYAFPDSGTLVRISGGIGEVIAAGFERVRSPWTNPVDPFDVSGNAQVEPLDALQILNDIARGGSRILRDPAQITLFVDANNDGELTPLDALVVLNEIARRSRAAGGESLPQSQRADAQSAQAFDAALALWSAAEEKEPVVGLWGASHEPLGIGEPLG
jgi:hypothetical protein